MLKFKMLAAFIFSHQLYQILYYHISSSTMPVASSVQTPELFKGSLKEYQLKGLQWLVNCYEQVIRDFDDNFSPFFFIDFVSF